MTRLPDIYRTSLSLLTDLYELTMAYAYWRCGRAELPAVFHLFFRRPPFDGGYAVAAGLAHVIDLFNDFKFDKSDLDYLRTLRGNDDKPLFDSAFLDYLARMEFTCDVDAVPEGTVVFGQEPLVRVTGPILQAQILESALLNSVNFQTLIATKAARVCAAAKGDPVLEFGLRRAQGIDGSLSAARAAYIGGCAATSNVLAGKLYGIPVRGTHAHSWVMSFDSELESFEEYARAMPNNCVFLVDTYDSISGVHHAVEVGRRLREKGHEMVGVRLDSGDLAYLSIQARRILDEGGFPKAAIMASNELDEHVIESLKHQGSTVSAWGVGTKLTTAFDQPALGGVYKLGAIQLEDKKWHHRIKLSEHSAKTTIPGMLQVRRFEDGAYFIGDMLFDEITGRPNGNSIVDPADDLRRKSMPRAARMTDLLAPVARGGRIVHASEDLDTIRSRVQAQLQRLHPTIRRFLNPHEYPVGLEPGLSELRARLIREARAAV